MTYVVYADGPSSARVGPATSSAPPGSTRPTIPNSCSAGPSNATPGWTTRPSTGARCSPAMGSPDRSRRAADARCRRGCPPCPRCSGNAGPTSGVIAAVRRGAGYAYSGSIGWGDVLATVAAGVVPRGRRARCRPRWPDRSTGDVVAILPRPDRAGHATRRRAPPTTSTSRSARSVASLVPDDATLQFGPGGVGEGIARALDRPVRLWSGLCTDSMAGLHERGLLLAPVVAAYTYGGRADPASSPPPGCSTSDRRRSPTTSPDLSSIPRFVGCNTALQVGLDGSVNVERVGGRVIAAVGGHSDFCAGASRSVGGVSVIAVRSTTDDR